MVYFQGNLRFQTFFSMVPFFFRLDRGIFIVYKHILIVLSVIKEKLFGSNKTSSKSMAKSRLSFVLVQDRTGLTNDEIAGFKSETSVHH